MRPQTIGTSWPYRYGLAVVSVACGTGLSRLLSGLGDSGISPQFFAAVVVSAWYGGRGPGLVATLLSGLAATVLLISAGAASAAEVRDTIFRVTMFTVVALLTSSLHAASLRAQQIAESANAAKSRFLAMVSHELLTPLSPILMATEMLLDDPQLPGRMRPDLETIARNLNIETRLINDLLDLTRISTGKLQIHATAVDVHPVLQAALNVCEADIRDRHQSLQTSFDAGHSIVWGDAVRLQQAFWNVIRNATKFTPREGTISVSTRNAGDKVCVTVRDTGIGIEPARLARIFDPFEQGDPTVRVTYGGLGLGLAICDALMKTHGGTIDVASEGQSRGAVFTLSLPLLADEDSAAGGPPEING